MPRGTKLSADKSWAGSLGQDRLALRTASLTDCWEKQGLDMLALLVALAPRTRGGGVRREKKC